MWEAYRRHYGKSDSDVLVWWAPTRVMNPSVPQAFIDRQFELDPASAEAEYNAQFRSDIEAWISREALEKVVIPGRHELPASR